MKIEDRLTQLENEVKQISVSLTVLLQLFDKVTEKRFHEEAAQLELDAWDALNRRWKDS